MSTTHLMKAIAGAAALSFFGAACAVDDAAALALVRKSDCLRCHAVDKTIAKTRHGTVADGRTPTCTSCHGDSKRHVENLKKEGESGRPKPDRTFSGQLLTAMTEDRVDRYFGVAGKRTSTPVEDRNSACLGCHQGGKRIHWRGSAHETRGGRRAFDVEGGRVALRR